PIFCSSSWEPPAEVTFILRVYRAGSFGDHNLGLAISVVHSCWSPVEGFRVPLNSLTNFPLGSIRLTSRSASVSPSGLYQRNRRSRLPFLPRSSTWALAKTLSREREGT